MNSERDPWKKLALVARQTPDVEFTTEVPYGFSTRVVAQWRSQFSVGIPGFVWNRLGLGALVSAVAVAAVCVALNYESVRALQDEGQDLATIAETEVIL